MIPGVNPRQLQSMMRQMGMSQEDIEAQEVVIKTSSGKKLVFSNPTVQKISMQGNTSFQITGDYSEEEESVSVEISKDDIDTVVNETGVSSQEAEKALEEVNGDIAEAIVKLSQ